MDEKSQKSNLVFIFFKSFQNELYGLLPLLSSLEINDLKPTIQQKLKLPKGVPFDLFSKDEKLSDIMSLEQQGLTPYSEITISFPSKLSKDRLSRIPVESLHKEKKEDLSQQQLEDSFSSTSIFFNLGLSHINYYFIKATNIMH